MKKIIWFSQHDPLQKQIVELEGLFGQVEIVRDTGTFSDADHVVRRYIKSKAVEIVAVAPLHSIDQITKRGIYPLYAEMAPAVGENHDVIARGKKFTFNRFTRIKKIKIIKEELKPDKTFLKKIMWFSRHEPIQKQIDELNRLFGQVGVIIDPNPISSADDIIDRFKKSGADDLGVVAPLSVIQQLTKQEIFPLRAEMKPGKGKNYDIIDKRRKYIFDRFVRIKGVEIVKEELRPPKS